jgi:crotonobetainyl-CoA:carnitine CoA-transferase CaiB-like acyl-CoA transferase
VLDRPTPGLGEHTEEVLAEVGYSKDDIAAFRRGKVV